MQQASDLVGVSAHGEKMPDLNLLAFGNGKGRNIEVWRTVRDMRADADKWRPLMVLGQPHELTWTAADVGDAIRSHKQSGKYLSEALEQKRFTETQAAKQVLHYRRWEQKVTQVESWNEGRLQGLLWALRELAALCREYPDTEELHDMMRLLTGWVVNLWRLDVIPETGLEAREVVAGVCTNTKSMPAQWRGL